ncbi:MAG: SDR family NAD(P)-dependent oxidoreductase [Akkermansiaceae bacterium]|nr:SDR family NAD(P)-dependent oxidoreductase [Akkermansiaceae bacterium]
MSKPTYHAAVFGATSAIATEILRAIVADRECELLLIGRSQEKLDQLAADLEARGASCKVQVADLLNAETDWEGLLKATRWDLLLIAQGYLPNQEEALADGATIARTVEVNFTSQAVMAAAGLRTLEAQKHGTLAVIGSVAGDRGRQSNFLYGATKAGIETLCRGMQHRLHGQSEVKVVLLKPGMTDTPMTADLPKGPLFSSAQKVGAAAWKAIRKGKRVAYLPGWWALVMLIIRSVPRVVFHRTKL